MAQFVADNPYYYLVDLPPEVYDTESGSTDWLHDSPFGVRPIGGTPPVEWIRIRAGVAIARLLNLAGCEQVTLCDSKGIISQDRDNLTLEKNTTNLQTVADNIKSTKNKQNRLASEKSPYLLQHADNPVDWYPYATIHLHLNNRLHPYQNLEDPFRALFQGNLKAHHHLCQH